MSERALALEQDAGWYALWTHSNCEHLVQRQLASKGYETFLPQLKAWKRRGRERFLSCKPMFPGYLFLRHSMDKAAYIDILGSRGLVRVLGERWDRLDQIPEWEIDAIRQVIDSGMPALPYPFLREGQRVRIARGPMAGMEGFLVELEPRKGILVLSIDLLQRSVAVEIDCTMLATVHP